MRGGFSPAAVAVAERHGGTLGGKLSREMLDHVIAFDGRHFLRLLGDYVSNHHHDRIQDALRKDIPNQCQSL